MVSPTQIDTPSDLPPDTRPRTIETDGWHLTEVLAQVQASGGIVQNLIVGKSPAAYTLKIGYPDQLPEPSPIALQAP